MLRLPSHRVFSTAIVFGVLLICTLTADGKARRQDAARGDYGNGQPDPFYGPSAIVVSDASGPLFSVTSFGRCDFPTVNCRNQLSPPAATSVIQPNFIYLFQIRVLRNITQPVTLQLSSIFDVPSGSVPAGSDTSDYGVVSDDQTYIASCANNFAYRSAAYKTCEQAFLVDANTNVDTTQTVLSIASGLQQDDVLLIHIDSYIPPACLFSSSSTTDPTTDPVIQSCIPNDFMTVVGATTPASQVVVVGPDPEPPPSPGPVQISSISPAQIAVGATATPVTITGSGFDLTAVLNWNGQKINPSSTPTSTQLTANIPASFFQNAGVSQVTITNADTSTQSNPVGVAVVNTTNYSFTINPTSAIQGSPTMQFTVTPTSGSFLSTSVVQLSTGSNCNNGDDRPTILNKAGQLVATFFSTDFSFSHLDVNSNSYTIQVFTQPGTSRTSVCPSASILSNLVDFEVTAAPVTMSPVSPLYLGSVNVGVTSASQIITVQNTSGGSLTMSGVSAMAGADPGDFQFVSNTCTTGLVLANNASCAISVSFKPTNVNLRSASFQITDNGTPGTQAVQLTGTGLGSFVTLGGNSINFGNQLVGSTSAIQMVSLTNTGTATLTISSIAVTGANSGDFSQMNSCGASVAAGAKCSISVSFTPTATGSRTASVTITDNAPGSPHTVTLSGTGAKHRHGQLISE